ncbi:hypothetical protein D3C75_1048330 [compost metagenome]
MVLKHPHDIHHQHYHTDGQRHAKHGTPLVEGLHVYPTQQETKAQAYPGHRRDQVQRQVIGVVGQYIAKHVHTSSSSL